MAEARSQYARIKLQAHIQRLGQHGTLDLGATRGKPTHQLAGIGTATPAELETGIRLSVDQARKSWTDIRAVSRVLGIPFIMHVRGTDIAVLRRHPEGNHKQIELWLSVRTRGAIRKDVRT